MSLLGPLFLLALPALAVPVALHLFRGRQPEVVEWGAMQFLVAAASQGRRWERLEELLLMALRVLALGALVLALAQPVLRTGWLGTHATREVVLLVDDSLSTAAAVGGDRLIDAIKQRAQGLIAGLTPDDHVQVMAASCGGRWLTAEPVAAGLGGRARLSRLIDALEPTEGPSDLLACAGAIAALEPVEGSTGRVAVVLTDGQALSWRLSQGDAWRALGKSAAAQAPPVRFQAVMDDTAEAPDNLALGPVSAARGVVRPGEGVRVTCEVTNFGRLSSDPVRLEWLVNGLPVGQSRVGALRPGQGAAASASVQADSAGPHVVECRIVGGDAALDLDDTSRMVLLAASSQRVLLVSGEREPDERDATLPPAALVAAALGYAGGEPQPWRSVFEPHVVAPDSFADEPLAGVAAVVVLHPDGLPAEGVRRLERFVASGGGLWVTLDAGVDATRFATLWHDDGEGLAPLELEGFEPLPGEGLTVHPPDASHPATTQLASATQLDLDRLRIASRWRFAPGVAGRPVSAVLESATGEPLVVERFYGQGRVLVQGWPMGLSASNLPTLRSFVVAVHDWLEYVSAPSRSRHNLLPGGAIVLPAAEASAAGAELLTPGGAREPLTPGRDGLLRTSATLRPGLYRVALDGEPDAEATPFHVARPLAESDLRPLDGAMRKALHDWAAVEFVAEPHLEGVLPEGETADGRPFWWPLLVAGALLLAAELLLSSHISHRRWGASAA